MKCGIQNRGSLAAALAGVVFGWSVQAAAPKANAKAAAKAKTAAVEVVTLQEIPKSVFTIPITGKKGRNPFFPDSIPDRGLARTAASNSVDVSALELKGITSPPKRTAIINNRTFEPGEEGEVKLASGARVLVKCTEIKDDSAVIMVGGKLQELKLPFGI